ncbi:MAG: twin transmembrane helix small protein [Sulfuricella sp.]|nr:twin transmembrane helix small protein [Sulfuricella sp.]
MFKIVVIALLGLVVASLFGALGFLVRDQGRGERVAKALTLRISLSLLLFAVLAAGFFFGLIYPR